MKKYNEILKQNESFWMQKSRVRWLNIGEGNTHYFHATIVARRRANKITSLKDNEGVWEENPDRLKNLARTYYANLHTAEDSLPQEDHVLNFPKLSHREV